MEYEPRSGRVAHLSTLGRDQFVRVVRKGFLFRSATVPSRLRSPNENSTWGGEALEGKPVAYLRQRTFVALREPVKRFAHRAFPFRTVTFKTLITPNLIDPPDEILQSRTGNANRRSGRGSKSRAPAAMSSSISKAPTGTATSRVSPRR